MSDTGEKGLPTAAAFSVKLVTPEFGSAPAEITGEIVPLLLMAAGIIAIAHYAPAGQKTPPPSPE